MMTAAASCTPEAKVAAARGSSYEPTDHYGQWGLAMRTAVLVAAAAFAAGGVLGWLAHANRARPAPAGPGTIRVSYPDPAAAGGRGYKLLSVYRVSTPDRGADPLRFGGHPDLWVVTVGGPGDRGEVTYFAD